MKKLIISLTLALSVSFTFGQNAEEDNVAFIYAVGERVDKKVKVVLVGRHIISFKGERTPMNSSIENKIILGFNKVMDGVEHREHVEGLNDYHNVTFGSAKLESVNLPNFDHDFKYQISSEDSKLDKLVKIRRVILNEFKSAGYKVYQIDFNPTKFEQFQTYKNSEWLGLTYSPFAPIDPLWIPYYVEGEIKAMTKAAGEFEPKKQSAGITVESKKESATTQKSSSTIDWEARAAMSKYKASLLEAEADRLYANISNHGQALAKYREAYALYPSPRIKQRIADLETTERGKQAIAQGVVGLEDGFDKIGLEHFSGWQFTYTGYPNYEVAPNLVSNPYSVEVAISNYRIIAYNFGFVYNNSPTFRNSLIDENLAVTNVGPLEYTLQSGGLTGAIGLGVPTKYFALYAMYGAKFLFFNDYTFADNRFTPEEEFKNVIKPHFQTYFKFGGVLRIPKIRLGIGLNYTMNTINNENVMELRDGNSKLRFQNKMYYLDEPLDKKYKFNQFGASLMYFFDR
jgi:hypothetical protein